MLGYVVPAILLVLPNGTAILYEREEGAGAIIFQMLYDGGIPILDMDDLE